MKELSIEQKAKRYDEAINIAKDSFTYPDYPGFIRADIVFPEIKENEDEKIRKELLQIAKESEDSFYMVMTPDKRKRLIAWLEKQGEQKSTDKIEPKFNVGDWVIFNEHHNSVYQVEKIQGLRYYLRHYLGGTLSVHFDNELIRLWNLQDAKSGDVLACNEEVLLFKSYSVQGRISLYCWYNGQTNNFHSKEVNDTLLTTRNKICPATKEQRDQLEKAMADAGYTFDFERKELKKIEHKLSKCSEEDEQTIEDAETWLDTLCDYLKDNSSECIPTVKEVICKLKSIKDKYTYKPSKEQMKALYDSIPANVFEISERELLLESLYRDLKKL